MWTYFFGLPVSTLHLILGLGGQLYEITISCFSAYLIALLTKILLKLFLVMLLMSISISWIYFKLHILQDTFQHWDVLHFEASNRFAGHCPSTWCFSLNQICLISCWRQMTGIYRHVTVKPKSFENIQYSQYIESHDENRIFWKIAFFEIVLDIKKITQLWNVSRTFMKWRRVMQT